MYHNLWHKCGTRSELSPTLRSLPLLRAVALIPQRQTVSIPKAIRIYEKDIRMPSFSNTYEAPFAC